MARLLVMRGDALEQEVALRDGRTIRIGRGATNDLVLEDPGKSVSRAHAELRCQGDRYVLVDLQSQNGIWVSGNRFVPQVLLEPNVTATIGPFRLLVEPSGQWADADREFNHGPTGESSYPESQLDGDSYAGANVRQPLVRPAARRASWLTRYRIPLVGAAAALGLGGGAWAMIASRSTSSMDYVAKLGEAEEMIAIGECKRALDEIIRPALEQSPRNGEAIRLAADAESCAEESPPVRAPGSTPPPADGGTGRARVP